MDLEILLVLLTNFTLKYKEKLCLYMEITTVQVDSNFAFKSLKY